MTNLGLPLSGVVNVQIVMSPLAAQERNFGSLLILSDQSSPAAVDVQERLRLYTTLDGVAADYGTTSTAYLAAALYFGQSPQPRDLYLGRWARNASRGLLRGALLSTAQKAISNFTGIANGAMNITIDGVVRNLSAMDFTAQTNLNGVAAVIATALGAFGLVDWDDNNGRLNIRSATSGIASGVSFASAPVGGTDVSDLLGLRSTSGGYSVQGIAAETLLTAVQTIGSKSNDWYGLQIAASVTPTTDDYVGVASYIEAAGVSRIFGVTTQDPAALDASVSVDLASVLKAAGYKRSFVQYSSSHAFASASIFGRAFTVNFDGSNTTITLKFKQEPGLTPETLTSSQAAALAVKRCNVFVRYNNDTAILQQGTMANGFFFDEVHGTDWLQNDLQTDVYNLLFTSQTKIPQTDAGINQIVARVSNRLEQAVNNGLVAPGVWNGPAIGALDTGDALNTGYYVFAPPVATQSQADREARKAPVLQAAIKLAGAVHSADIIVNVNR